MMYIEVYIGLYMYVYIGNYCKRRENVLPLHSEIRDVHRASSTRILNLVLLKNTH